MASIRGEASFEVDNLVLFDYLGESEIWSDKSGDLWGEVPYNRVTTECNKLPLKIANIVITLNIIKITFTGIKLLK